jgi:hypothetical protein
MTVESVQMKALILLVSVVVIFLPLPSGYRDSAAVFSGLDAPAQSDAVRQSQGGAVERARVAEGEYRVYRRSDESGIGPFAPSVYNFRESWTLWRLPEGDLEVTGKRDYDSPENEPHEDAFSVRLSAKFQVIRITEFRKLRWRPDSGPLICDFLSRKLDCTSGAKNPHEEVHLSLPLEASYGFLWPVSAFSLSNITRFADRDSGRETTVDMITIDEASALNPVTAMILEGRLQYLGQEEIRVAEHKWRADKFELKVPLHSPFMIWTSRQGLLLDFTLEDNQKRLTERGMQLVRYQRWEEF